MACNLGQKGSAQQLDTDSVKEENLLPSAGKYKVQQPFGKPYIDRRSGLRLDTSFGNGFQFKSSENKEKSWSGSKTCKDDELVKHMSNLPRFLQGVEEQKSIQKKALNFGVLDWKRLEKWKYNERMPTNGQTEKSSSCSSTAFMASGPHLNPRKLPSLHGLNSSSPYRGGRFTSHNSHFNPLPQGKESSSHISHDNLSQGGDKIKGVKQYKGTCIQDFQGAQNSSTIHGLQENFHEKVESDSGRQYMGSGKKKDSEKEILLGKGTLSLDQIKYEPSLTSRDTISSPGGRVKARIEDEVNLAGRYHPVDAKNNVLPVRKHFSEGSNVDSSQFIKLRASFDGLLMGSRTSFDEQFAEANRNGVSDCFSPEELYSGEFSSDIAHSCPLPTGVSDHDKPDMKLHNLVTSQPMNSDTCTSVSPSNISITLIPSEAKHSRVNVETVTPSCLDSAKDARRTYRGIAEELAARGRHPSSNRRFNFGLGEMSRSFSFKESSPVQKPSSTCATTKACRTRHEVSSGSVDKCDRDKSNASGRGRSSPLRRLLDPLLKYKGSHSSDTLRTLDGTSNSTLPANSTVQDRMAKASTLKAFLQITLKKGLPFFKLVVDNSSVMLAAVIKSLPSSEKSDCGMIYAFYSLQEMRKKSVNWINSGSKSKSHGLGYNMIGQMKISSSIFQEISMKASVRHVIRECVLYSVDPGQLDAQTHEYLLNREIAAIVVKNLNDVHFSDNCKQCIKSEFSHTVSGVTYDSDKLGNSNSTIVILPGGCHGIPVKGAPSSLLNRWKSGGSCDCGGWDVGCKLRILTNYKKDNDIFEPSISSSAIDHVKLYLQDGVRESKSTFSLEPSEDGLYSVKFDTSIPLLETFSMCVAIITCQKFSEILDMNIQPEVQHFPEAMARTLVQGQTSAKYVTCPPPSPVGRI